MSKHTIYLASDNCSPAHPAILKAIMDANHGYASSYGSDPWTEEAQKTLQAAFNSKCKVFFVPTGTGSNVFALKLACRSYESVLCTDIAHIVYQETGAPEAIIGCKLTTIPHEDGKLTSDALVKRLKIERAFGKHSNSPHVVSITQPTEFGTVYSLEEIRSLSEICKKEGLFLHVDGSRLYNAAVSLGVSLEEMITSNQVDILSLGGTKNGLMGSEALLIFNPELQEGSDYLQKQTLQLPSKMRFFAAQFTAFFENDLWKELASHANKQAKKLEQFLQTIPSLALSCKVETNQIFFTVPPSWISLIQEKIYCYIWNEEKHELRWITSWGTTDEDIDDVKKIMLEIAR